MKTLREFTATQRNVSIEELASIVGIGACDLEYQGCEFYSVYGKEDIGYFYIGHNKLGGYNVEFDMYSYDSDDLDVLEQILWDGYAKQHTKMDGTDIIEDLHERARDLIEEVNKSCSLDEIPLSVFNKTQLRQRNYIMDLFDGNFKPKTLTSTNDPEGYGGRERVMVSDGWTLVRNLVNNAIDFASFADDNQSVVQFYTTRREAEIELADHIIDCATAFKRGDMDSIDTDCEVVYVQEFEDGHYEAFNEYGDPIASHVPEKVVPQKKKFKLTAEVVTYATIEVEATSAEEAEDMGREIDGGDFVTVENDGSFTITDVKEI